MDVLNATTEIPSLNYPYDYGTNRSVDNGIPKKIRSKNKKLRRVKNLSAEFIEKLEKKLCYFFAHFSLHVVFLERIDTFALG